MNVMVRMSNRLDPAYSVIRKFDLDGRRGPLVLAERLGVDRSTVQKWSMSRDTGGTGGYIPSRHYEAIMESARELGVSLDEREFVKKSDDAEIAA
jgi:hypothetical protein